MTTTSTRFRAPSFGTLGFARIALLPLLLTAGVFAATPAADPVLPGVVLATDFNTLNPGELPSGWLVKQGRAAVVEGVAGARRLALVAGAVEAEVRLPALPAGVSTFSFSAGALPACDRAESREFVNVAGALVALVKDGDRAARLWVLDAPAGLPESADDWIPTPVTLPLGDDGALSGHAAFEFRIDRDQSLWFLSVDGREVTSGCGLDSTVGLAPSFHGFAASTWFVEACSVSTASSSSSSVVIPGSLAGANPPGAKTSGVGLPGTKKPRSTTPDDLPAPTTRPAGIPLANPTSGTSARPRISVDAAAGDDTGDGTPAHPKATLRAAFAALPRSGGDIVIAGGDYVVPSRTFPGVRLVMNGRVNLR